MQGPVLYIAAEGKSGLNRRRLAWEDHNAAKMAVMFLPKVIRLPADATVVGMLAAELGAVLVVIDTQSRCAVGLEENSSKDMGLLVDALVLIAERSGACVLVLHHEARNGDAPRGHSTMDGGADSLLRVVKDGQLVTAENPKQRDEPGSESVRLVLTPHLRSAVLTPIPRVGVDNYRTDSETKIKDALLALVGVKGGASYTDLKNESGLASSSLTHALNALVSKGEMHNTGTKKRSFYVPGPAPEPMV